MNPMPNIPLSSLGLVSSLPPTPEELGKDAFVAICKVLLVVGRGGGDGVCCGAGGGGISGSGVCSVLVVVFVIRMLVVVVVVVLVVVVFGVVVVLCTPLPRELLTALSPTVLSTSFTGRHSRLLTPTGLKITKNYNKYRENKAKALRVQCTF